MFSPSVSPRISSLHGAAQRRSVFGTLLRGAALWRSRNALAKLTPSQLDDIGLTAAQAQHEARRPIWDAPVHWYR